MAVTSKRILESNLTGLRGFCNIRRRLGLVETIPLALFVTRHGIRGAASRERGAAFEAQVNIDEVQVIAYHEFVATQGTLLRKVMDALNFGGLAGNAPYHMPVSIACLPAMEACLLYRTGARSNHV